MLRPWVHIEQNERGGKVEVEPEPSKLVVDPEIGPQERVDDQSHVSEECESMIVADDC